MLNLIGRVFDACPTRASPVCEFAKGSINGSDALKLLMRETRESLVSGGEFRLRFAPAKSR